MPNNCLFVREQRSRSSNTNTLLPITLSFSRKSLINVSISIAPEILSDCPSPFRSIKLREMIFIAPPNMFLSMAAPVVFKIGNTSFQIALYKPEGDETELNET